MSSIDKILSIDNKCWSIIFMNLSIDEYCSVIDKYDELKEREINLLIKHNNAPTCSEEFRTLYSDEYKDLHKDFEDLYEELQNIED